MIIVTTSISKSSVFKMFSCHTKTQSQPFSNSSGLKSVSKVWTVGETVEIELRFEISPAQC